MLLQDLLYSIVLNSKMTEIQYALWKMPFVSYQRIRISDMLNNFLKFGNCPQQATCTTSKASKYLSWKHLIHTIIVTEEQMR